MKIYSRTNSTKGRRTIDQVIGKDIWFKCFYRNDMYWYHITSVTDTNYIGNRVSDTYAWRRSHEEIELRKVDVKIALRVQEIFPIRNYKKRFNEALQSPYADICTTAELFGLSEEDLEDDV